MSEKSASAVEALEREFEELTPTADAELDAERQRIVMEFIQANGRGSYADAFSPGLQRAIRRLPSGANNGVTSGTFASTFITGTRSAMWAAVIGAAYQLITGLPQIYAAPEAERLTNLITSEGCRNCCRGCRLNRLCCKTT
uniref:Uncharacterized protein n=1 Tax=Photinus pyralis TaxID=7054 RepID=A0A1Y1M4V6_PHOPY